MAYCLAAGLRDGDGQPGAMGVLSVTIAMRVRMPHSELKWEILVGI